MQKHKIPFFLSLFLLMLINDMQAKESILNGYILQGLENNLALKQKNFSLEQSIQELKEARGMFLPSIAIDARYSRAGGGRVIDLPVGDIINPMHTALNVLLGEPGLFPANLENVRTPFLREKEQETKLRLVQPVFQPDIYYNYKIKSELKEIQQAEKNLFTRELIRDIKEAYFNYLKTTKIVQLFTETKNVVKENLYVSEKLFQANKATREVVFRAEAELSLIDQQKLAAENQQALARSYFNFLLNNPLSCDIIIDDSLSLFRPCVFTYDQLITSALENRDEIKQLKLVIDISTNKTNIAKSKFLPAINGVIDYGFQGEEYRFADEDDFWMASVVLQWNLFHGFQDQAKYQQSITEKRKQKIKYEELEKQIELQVRQAYDNLQIAVKKIDAANQQLNSARASFNIIKKKYAQGMSSQIEFLDARNSLTNAEINLILTVYDYHINCADMERISATYPLNK